MSMICCSKECKKRADCAVHCLNNFDGTYQIEDFENYGSCTMSDKGIERDWWCGRRGNYKMFEPVSKRKSADELIEKFYKVNVNVLDEDGNFRSTHDVLKDIAAVWFKE